MLSDKKTVRKGRSKIHIVYSWRKGISRWISNYRKGLVPGKMPYGLHGLEYFGYRLSYKDIVELPFLTMLRNRVVAISSHFLVRMDLVNALLQIGEMRKSDIILTTLDPDSLAVALFKKLGFLGKDRKRKLCCILCWFTDDVAKVGPVRKALLRWITSEVDLFLVWQSSQVDTVAKELNIPPRKVAFLPFCVDTEFFRPMAPNSTGDYILSVGADRDRDYLTLIRSVQDTPFHLILVVRNWCKVPSRIPANVTVLREVPIYKLRDLYSRARFVVITLKPNSHGSGTTTILEAMAMGKAVILSRIKGFRDYFIDGRTVTLVEPENVEELSKAISFLWNHPEKCEEIGRNARRFIEGRFNIDEVSRHLASIISRVETDEDPLDFS